MAYAKKTDRNHKMIIACFRALGCLVYSTHTIGGGFPDIIVQHVDPRTGFNQTYLIEIKDGEKPPSARCLTKAEAEFHALWDCHIIESEADVFRLLGVA